MDPFLLDELNRCVQHALKEDDVHNDITSLSYIPHMESIEAKIYLKQKAYVSGLVFLTHIFKQVDPSVRIQLNAQDGEEYEEGTILAQIIGNSSKILSVERVILNLLSHTSGITNQTAKFVEAVKEHPCDIFDTRKTLPGLRHMQKYAVRMGGGKNHRLNLSDKIFIRDHHISILKHTHRDSKLRNFANPGASIFCSSKQALSKGNSADAEERKIEDSEAGKNPNFELRCVNKSGLNLLDSISQVRSRFPDSHVEIEVTDIDFFDEALAANPNSILLSNLEIEDVREAVLRSRDAKNIYLEASGTISIENVKQYAKTGVDGISIGALTQSVKAVDMSLKI